LRFNQPPFAYVKKSWPGFTVGSRLAWRKSGCAGVLVVVTEGLHAEVKTTADTHNILRESSMVLDAREGDFVASCPGYPQNQGRGL